MGLASQDKATENNANEDQTAGTELSIQMAGGYSLNGAWIGCEADAILIKSAELGECRIEIKSIQSFHSTFPQRLAAMLSRLLFGTPSHWHNHVAGSQSRASWRCG